MMEKAVLDRAWFDETCRKNGYQISSMQLDKLELFVQLLLEWNKKVNLISRKDVENVWNSHILHSTSLLFELTLPKGAKIIDIGTGGGLPGIPLKILQPDLQITLLDSTQKKIVAVNDILQKLAIQGISTLEGRVEELAREPKYQSSFDVAVARAVAPLKTLILWSLPILTKKGGQKRETTTSGEKLEIQPPALLAMKGGNLEEEILQAHQVKGVSQIKTLRLRQAVNSSEHNDDKKVACVYFYNNAHNS